MTTVRSEDVVTNSILNYLKALPTEPARESSPLELNMAQGRILLQFIKTIIDERDAALSRAKRAKDAVADMDEALEELSRQFSEIEWRVTEGNNTADEYLARLRQQLAATKQRADESEQDAMQFKGIERVLG